MTLQADPQVPKKCALKRTRRGGGHKGCRGSLQPCTHPTCSYVGEVFCEGHTQPDEKNQTICRSCHDRHHAAVNDLKTKRTELIARRDCVPHTIRLLRSLSDLLDAHNRCHPHSNLSTTPVEVVIQHLKQYSTPE